MEKYSIMYPSKQTENKLRYETEIEGTLFYLYLPKWRVPEPWPRGLKVVIDDNWIQHRAYTHGRNSKQPIQTYLVKYDELTQTARYRPMSSDVEDWETGEPYIPYDLLSTPPPDKLYMEVFWDYSLGIWDEE